MAFTGYSNSGQTYSIGSDKGMAFVQDAPAGSVLNGGDGSTWTKNKDGSTTISKNGNTYSVGAALGSVQSMMDKITNQSELASARSLDYALQNQEWSANQAAIARNFNASEAAKNRDWQAYMSNTAHQREVKDLQAAGLNPVLSAMNGNGASVGSGSAASASLPSGATGKSDESSNTALVSLLGSMLAAQTSLANQAVSARTQEAVADKYTAMEQIVALIGANASMSNARTAAAASRYSADSSRVASMYSSDKSYAASVLSTLLGYDADIRGQDIGYQENVNNNQTSRWISNNQQMSENQRALLKHYAEMYGIDSRQFSDLMRTLGIVLR